VPTPPSFHASPLPSNKAGSSAHCRVMNTGNMFEVLTLCILEESSYKIMIYRASRWRLRQRTHIKARNKPAIEPENFAAVNGVYIYTPFLSLFLFFTYLLQQTLILVDSMTVSDGKKLFCYALILCENGNYITNLFSHCKFRLLPLILCDTWIFMMDFLVIESYLCNLGILILITVIQKYLDKMY